MTAIPQSVLVHPASSLSGTVEVPGDKSISHRVAMLAGLAKGKSVVRNFLQSEDFLSTLKAMEALGARSFSSEEGELVIQGNGGNLMEPAGILNCGNSGTSIRLLTGLLSGQAFPVTLTGDESLCTRPMGRIREPLERMGAKIELTGERGTPPVRITGGRLKAIDYVLPVASAQVKSCILLAGLSADGTTTVTEPVPTRDHTERLLRTLQMPITIEGAQIKLTGFGESGPPLAGRTFQVPGDFSSAAYWLAAGAIRRKSSITVRNVGLNPRRVAFLDVLRRMGADLEIKPRENKGDAEPVGDIRVSGGRLKGVDVGGTMIPNLIDEVPLIAVLAAVAEGRTTITNAAELRVKESDRIAAMASNLRLLGVQVDEQDDGMTIVGAGKLKPTGPVRSFGDHRVAMAMAILATVAADPVMITNTSCVDTSYPGFWKDLRSLGANVE
jgi:3-phosphoshikimate 1-carboxyvinyltransferase